MIRRLLISLMLLLSMNSWAQSKKYDREEKKIFSEADSYYLYGDYLNAKNLFLKIYQKDSLFPEINYKIGHSLYELKKYNDAESYLQKGIPYNLDANYLIAAIYLDQAQLKKASDVLLKYKTNRNSKLSIYSDNQLNRLMGQIKVADSMMAIPEVINIINLGSNINTKNAEYVPLISADELKLIFTSRRDRIGNGIDPTGEPFEDVYISKKEKGKWGKAVPIPGNINTEKHDACVGLSPDGKRLFVYRSNENLIGGDIYESELVNGNWTAPQKLGPNINSEKSIEPSVSLSLDEHTLYFSSNREGGLGGFDIYRVKLLPNGEWSLPKSLGPIINTPFDDDAPFIHPNGHTLYFSSKGHKNMGGFDVFKSQLVDDEWTKPVNMGYPTNTTKDDIFFVMSPTEQHGYYSTEKDGGFGEQDIYMIDYLEKSLHQSVINGKVNDASNGKVLNAYISLQKLNSTEDATTYVSDPYDGYFIFLVDPNEKYEMTVELDGFKEYRKEIEYSIKDLMKTQQLNISLEKAEK